MFPGLCRAAVAVAGVVKPPPLKETVGAEV